jgi:putative transposase
MKLNKVFRFRMRPNAAEREALSRMAGARRFIWNWALAQRGAYYRETGKSISHGELSRRLTELKRQPEMAWLKEVDSQAMQQVLVDLQRAYVNFFEKRARYPKFKSRKRDKARFRIPQRVKIADGRVYVPKVGSVRIRQSRAVDGDTKSATFKRDASGNWYVSLVTEFTMPDMPLVPARIEATVGVDLGLKDFAVLSTGECIPTPKFFRQSQVKLRRAQRVLARREKLSNRRKKAKRAAARIQAKTANRRSDFLHKVTTELVRNHEAICIEDLSLKGLAKTKLAKSVLDAGLGEFRRELEYKTVWNRKHLAVVDRFYPSSKTCHVCGAVNDLLALADRNWTCACGAAHDRDFNASLNIKSEGLNILVAAGHAGTLNCSSSECKTFACGGGSC